MVGEIFQETMEKTRKQRMNMANTSKKSKENVSREDSAHLVGPAKPVKPFDKLAEAKKNMLKSLELPDRYQGKDFDNFKADLLGDGADKIIKEIQSYASSFVKLRKKNNWALFTGGYGLGKTHLAVAAFREAAVQWAYHMAEKSSNPYYPGRPDLGRTFHFITSSDLIQELRNSYDSELQTEEATLSRYKRSYLLLLDDLGTERASDWQKEKLHLILNYRYNHLLPTIITTNLDSAELKGQITQRLLDRIIEATDNGRYIWQLNGESYRMKSS